jgi:hypothetical protein
MQGLATLQVSDKPVRMEKINFTLGHLSTILLPGLYLNKIACFHLADLIRPFFFIGRYLVKDRVPATSSFDEWLPDLLLAFALRVEDEFFDLNRC